MIHRTRWFSILLILTVTTALGGCLGVFALKKSPENRFLKADGTVGKPDNCTKCHLEWAKRFEYHRGWDRYGLVFEGTDAAGYYDPWTRRDVTNMFEVYYASGWWKSPELYVWPENIAQNATEMSVLARPGGMPKIPKSRADISGPVLVVAKTGGDYTSINKAVGAAKPGTTVFVRAGEYDECIVLGDGVSLIGENTETTIINPHNRGNAVVAANNSVIAGFTLTGTGIDYASRRFNCAVYVSGCDSTCIIANNIFRENGLFGVWIDGTPDRKANNSQDKEYGPGMIEVIDRVYTDYPNPVVAGNTFYRIGQRAVFFVHARGEIFNNVFSGNVKALGLERHSRPYVHNNVFYFNNVPMAVNRSEPVISNNIFLRNQWGQRMLRGANPVIFGNVTSDSPFFRDFNEEGLPTPYETVPGTGERSLNPEFSDPLNGDFSFAAGSPLSDETTGLTAVGIMRDQGLPQPKNVACKSSWGREVLHMSDDIVRLIDVIDEENGKIQRLEASYTITYEDYVDITADGRGNPVRTVIDEERLPVAKVEYTVPRWVMRGRTREKEYSEVCTVNGESTADGGVIRFDGSCLSAEGGRFASLYDGKPDPLFIGERPFREAPGGFYRDYDQFVYGEIGTTGTSIIGLLRILGGKFAEGTVTVDGHECHVVRYPHIGKDQYCLFYLDPKIGWRPRRMEQFYNESPFRVMDGYDYHDCGEGIFLPVHVRVTEYAVRGGNIGKPSARWELDVNEQSLRVNGRP